MQLEWQLAPKEPTAAMLAQGSSADKEWMASDRKTHGLAVIYAAMLQAAPEPPHIDEVSAESERLVFACSMWKDAQDMASRYAWALHAIAVMQPADASDLRHVALDALRGGWGVPIAARNSGLNVKVTGAPAHGD